MLGFGALTGYKIVYRRKGGSELPRGAIQLSLAHTPADNLPANQNDAR
jgi:putative NIF3 family GTP cyclohydrolase 1 type 2